MDDGVVEIIYSKNKIQGKKFININNMKIKKKKILNPEPYLRRLDEKQHFCIGIKSLPSATFLKRIGYSEVMPIGTSFIPIPIGSISDFNTNGKIITRKDQKKKWQYRDGEITDWHGNSHNVSIRYLGYPKEKVAAPKVPFVVKDDYGIRILTSPLLTQETKSHDEIKHVINLFLEIFEECEILYENFIPLFSNVKKLNWKILPKGERFWDNIKSKIESLISSTNITDEKKQEITTRIKKLSDMPHDFIAFGEEGFNGYVIFGFETKSIYVLESVYHGNATYIFGNDWEELSKMTKGEIIDGNRQKGRIVHNKSWEANIDSTLV